MKTVFNMLKILVFGLWTIACSSGTYENPDRLHIEMLDVGQGLSFLIRGRNCDFLYDTGTPISGIDTMLQNRGVKSLCSVVLSHWHNDHVGGIPMLAQMAKNGEIQIKRVLFARDIPLENGTSGTSRFRDSCLTLLEQAGIETTVISRGDTIADFLPWTARILFPTEDYSLTENNASVVLRISDSQNAFLFMGDLEAKQEKKLLELEPLLEAFALQMGHHGSKTSSSWDFLAQVQPKMTFISDGKNNSYGHPHPETLAKLRIILPDTTQIYRSDRDGRVRVEWIYKVGMWRE
ncbi:MAG: MBL fold metallo-hydrolase [Fibromonadaceae bacterium]|jgi:competence protein ComEC|nr:MBL fold metallo-hydrolase [Fibromonadaceae bacterium]